MPDTAAPAPVLDLVLPEDAEYMAAYPFVVVHVDRQDGAFALTSYATMRQALAAPRRSQCQAPIVFGSWADYYEWKDTYLAIANRPLSRE